MLILQGARSPERDRTEAYSGLARRIADADVVAFHPLAMPPYERRLHVRRTLREDHQFRILNRPEGAQSKFDKLADGLYDFFRGTALLYYRDYAGTDGDLPAVVTLGDVHPENFGVMPNEDGAPIFGVNDFDEAAYAPFSYDVKRGAVGFWLAGQRNGHKKKHRRRAVHAFVEGYLDGLAAFAKDDAEKWHEYRIDNSPDMIKRLLKGATEPRRDFLGQYLDVDKRRFRSTEEVVPHSKHVDAFQKAVDAYVEDNGIEIYGQRDGYFDVCDVAIKKGSGTASLGLDRFWVLVEGPDPDDPADWEYLQGYSPYHLVDPDAAYPPILLTTSTRDDRVHPGHARKMAARLATAGKDVTYWENIEGGHGGAADAAQQATMQALIFTFLRDQLMS